MKSKRKPPAKFSGDLLNSGPQPASAGFPSFPTGGDVSISAGIGAYGKVSVIDGAAEGTVTGIGSVKVKVLPDFALSELAFQLTLDAVVGSCACGR